LISKTDLEKESPIIIKIGGAKGIDYEKVLDDIAEISKQEKIVIVHGGKSQLEEVSTKLGKPPVWIKTASGFTSRRTDKETMEMFTMVYAGKMNKMIVEKLQQKGVNAVGLSAMDGKLAVAQKKNIKIITEEGKKMLLRDDYTGKIIQINPKLLNLLLDNNFIPAICPPAISEDGEALNVDGDRLTAMIAESLRAKTVIYLSNIPGLLKDKDDESTLIENISKENIEEFMQYAKGTMKKKVMGAIESVEKGVEKVIFADARIESPIKKALEGKGTIIR
jgi:acetylglutamate/LysW-gamma-L-alpha-aminoadipate kinase